MKIKHTCTHLLSIKNLLYMINLLNFLPSYYPSISVSYDSLLVILLRSQYSMLTYYPSKTYEKTDDVSLMWGEQTVPGCPMLHPRASVHSTTLWSWNSPPVAIVAQYPVSPLHEVGFFTTEGDPVGKALPYHSASHIHPTNTLPREPTPCAPEQCPSNVSYNILQHGQLTSETHWGHACILGKTHTETNKDLPRGV